MRRGCRGGRSRTRTTTSRLAPIQVVFQMNDHYAAFINLSNIINDENSYRDAAPRSEAHRLDPTTLDTLPRAATAAAVLRPPRAAPRRASIPAGGAAAAAASRGRVSSCRREPRWRLRAPPTPRRGRRPPPPPPRRATLGRPRLQRPPPHPARFSRAAPARRSPQRPKSLPKGVDKYISLKFIFLGRMRTFSAHTFMINNLQLSIYLEWVVATMHEQ